MLKDDKMCMIADPLTPTPPPPQHFPLRFAPFKIFKIILQETENAILEQAKQKKTQCINFEEMRVWVEYIKCIVEMKPNRMNAEKNASKNVILHIFPNARALGCVILML